MEGASFVTEGVVPTGRGRKLIGGNWKCNGKWSNYESRHATDSKFLITKQSI